MRTDDDSARDTGPGLLTGVLLIVLAGAALGFGHNALLLAAGPNKGLAWVRTERALASLEELVAVRDTAVVPPAGGSPGPDASGSSAEAEAAPMIRAPSPTLAGPQPAAHPEAAMPPASRAGPSPTVSPERAVAVSPVPVPIPATSPPAAGAPVIPDMREPLEAKYGTVRALWDANAAVFVDARTAAEFAEERIARAVSLPLDDIGRRPELVANFSSGGRPVVVYCGGGECELSKNLAWNLVDAGHRKVLVYLGGIAEWKQRGAPLATGDAGGGR